MHHKIIVNLSKLSPEDAGTAKGKLEDFLKSKGGPRRKPLTRVFQVPTLDKLGAAFTAIHIACQKEKYSGDNIELDFKLPEGETQPPSNEDGQKDKQPDTSEDVQKDEPGVEKSQDLKENLTQEPVKKRARRRAKKAE